VADVALRQVRKRFGDLEIIRGVDLEVRDNEFAVFVGPSGCGKSTLLRIIAGLEDPTEGDVLIDGARVNDLLPAQRGIAMVFQSYALYPHMTVYDNMAFGLRLAKLGKAGVDQRVREAARILQIEHQLARKPRELSGGQRQRVAIGRAITREPKVFLFDEPLSNLDAALRVQMRVELARLHHELRATMIYVTHDQVEAMTLADKIVVLNAGRVEQVGGPLELYHRPRNLFVAGFIGTPRMNFIETEATEVTPAAVAVRLPGGQSLRVPARSADGRVHPGAKLTLGVRPEHVCEPGRGDAALSGQVLVVERLGSESFAYLKVDGAGTLIVRSDPSVPVRVGDQVRVGLPGEESHLFDAEGVALGRPEPPRAADVDHAPRARA
jgi:multiple sugar transport system ATP-binding protein